MSPHHRDAARSPTLDPEDETPPRHVRLPETPSEGQPAQRRASKPISESTTVKLTLGAVVALGLAMVGMTWKVSDQVREIRDRLTIEERTLRVVAKKVGVEAVDLGPDHEDH